MKIRLPSRKPMPPMNRPPKLKLKASVARARRAPIVEDEDDFLDEPEPNMKLSHAFVVVLVLHVIAVAGVFAFNSIKARQADIFSATKNDPPALAQSTNEPPAAPPDASSDPSNGGGAMQPNGDSSSAPTTAAATATPTPAPTAPATPGAKTHEMQPGETLTKVAAEYGVTVAALEQANNITDPKKIRVGTVLTLPAGSSSAPVAVAPVPKPAAPTATPTAESAAAAAKIKDSGQVYTVAKGDNPVRIAKKLKVPYADLMALNGNPDPRKLQIGQKLKIPASTK
jgi:LysM repeat protein